MISRLYFPPQAQHYKNDGADDHCSSPNPTPFAPPASPAVQPVFLSQPCQPCRESPTLIIDSQLTTTTVSLRLCQDTPTKMAKCDGGETGCDGKSRNTESWCGPCVRAKRGRGEKVVNRVSPSTAALSKALKKVSSDRSAHEQSECDRYGLRCVFQCTQCWLHCSCSDMRRADSRICVCTRSRGLCAISRAKKHWQTSNPIFDGARKEARAKSKLGVFLTDKESRLAEKLVCFRPFTSRPSAKNRRRDI